MSPGFSEGGKLSPTDSDAHSLPTLLEEVDELGQASVYIYKRSSESSAEILQPLISQDPRQFRLSGHRMQEVMQIDRALTEHGKAEVFTDTYRSAQSLVTCIFCLPPCVVITCVVYIICIYMYIQCTCIHMYNMLFKCMYMYVYNIQCTCTCTLRYDILQVLSASCTSLG